MPPVELRPELRVFAEALEIRLRENDHKEGWDRMPVRACLDRAHDEFWELTKEVVHPDPLVTSVLHESEDAANFLFFLWWNARRELA